MLKPTFTDVIVGWRWLRRYNTGLYGHASAVDKFVITSQLSIEAECISELTKHSAPDKYCSCGYAILRDPYDAVSIPPYFYTSHNSFLTLVLGLGKTIEHDRGWRTQQVRYLFSWEPHEGVRIPGVPCKQLLDTVNLSLQEIRSNLASIPEDDPVFPYARLAIDKFPHYKKTFESLG